MCIFAFGSISSLPNSFAMMLIHSTILLCSLGYQFCTKIVCFARIRLLVCFPVISHYCLKEFLFSLFWNVMFCLYRFTLSWCLFNFPSFSSSFWFISSSCIVIFSCVAFSLLSQHVSVFFLCFIIFACYLRFLICVSSRVLIFNLCFLGDPNFFIN